MNAQPPLPLTLSQSIAREEGWYATEVTRCQRNNNPGNLEYGVFTQLHGATGTDGRFAIFPDGETGMECLVSLLETATYRTHTIASALEIYAPSSENQTDSYITNVCTWMQEDKTTPLAQLQASNRI